MPKTSANRRLALVDGSGYIFRAYHALPPLTRRDGTAVGAVYGFTNMLMKLQQELDVDYLAVVFDAARHNFRNDLYPRYKANRDAPPEDLVPQFALVREATDALNIPRIELENYEADDVIAAYARQCAGDDLEVMIVSSDKDLMQLIGPNVYMYEPMKQKELREEEVLEKFGVTPDKVIEVQALIGDSIDNIPGVPGIGPKTAAQLIGEYGSLNALLERASEIKQNKRRESLIECADQARLSYELVKLKDDLPLPLPLESLVVRPEDGEKLLSFLQENDFKALLKKKSAQLGVEAPPAAAPAGVGEVQAAAFDTNAYTLITDMETLERWITEARAVGIVAVDTETTSLDATQAKLVGVSLATAPGKACYIPLGHVEALQIQRAQTEMFGGSGQDDTHERQWHRAAGQMALEDAIALLKPLLEDPAVLKIGQNIKYDALVLAQHGMTLCPVDDTMLLSYVTSAGLHGHGMDELSQLWLNHAPIAYKSVVGSGKQQKCFSEIELAAACRYAAEDADITLRLWQRLKPELWQHQVTRVYEQIERPLIAIIAAMEQAGIKVSPQRLNDISSDFAQKLAALEARIHEQVGDAVNIGSPKQLGELLFDKLGMPGGKKGKTGAYATGAEVLEELAASGYTIAEDILSWRQIAKLKSTYSDALIRQIHPETGRVHTRFSMTGAATGRLSSSDPNVQNIPIRTEEGRKIREAFIAEPGHLLISADYSQIELRLLAHIADIPSLKTAFQEGRDIHAATASQMFGVPLESVDSELRRKAKTINFGIIYGISAHGLATRLRIGRAEAGEYIAAYFEQYPGIKDYMERTKAEAREQGYVSTLYGRRVHVKDIHAKNPNLRAFSERAAINAPLQGTAADIIKLAMRRVYDTLTEQFPKARLLLQVHDELIVEAPQADAKAVASLIKKEMSGAAQLSVPLLVEAGIGTHWGEIH